MPTHRDAKLRDQTEPIHSNPVEALVDGPEVFEEPEVLAERKSTATQIIKNQNETFVTLVANGVDKDEAAALVGAKPTTIMRRQDVVDKLRETMQYYIADPAHRRAYILARAQEVAMNAPKDADVLGALAIMQKDPEVNMGAGRDAVNVNIKVDDLIKATERLPENIPGYDDEQT